MKIKKINGEYAVCKINHISQIPFLEELLFFAKTENELSLVCKESAVPAVCVSVEKGWRVLMVEGQLDFSLIGIIARIASILAAHKISIFVVSTYNTDYLLIKQENFEKACSLLLSENYEIV